MMKKLGLLIGLLGWAGLMPAADYYVDVHQGNDRNPGSKTAPWRQVNRAIGRLKAGDTLYILPASTPIQGNLNIRNVRGTAEQPITIDGMNNIFSGVRPLKVSEWQKVSPGLFRCERKMGKSMAGRFFFVVKGKQQRMGRFLKAPCGVILKKPEALQPGEWTIVDPEPKNRGQHIFQFYIRLNDNAPASEFAQWREPYLTNGAGFKGDCSYVKLRNVIVRHFWNDGFNFHRNIRHVELENIAAVECSDDGISAHEHALIKVRKYVSIGNSTGICHIGHAECHHEQIYIEKTLGTDILFIQDTINSLHDAWILGNSRSGFGVYNHTGSFSGKNIVAVNRHRKAQFNIQTKPQVKVAIDNVKISGYKPSRKNCPGVQKVASSAELLKEIQAKRQEFFAGFGGNLEKALQ